MNLRARRYTKPAFALLVSLSVAGTCLAVPALADDSAPSNAFGLLAASADAARAEEAAEAPVAPEAVKAPAVPEAAETPEAPDAPEAAEAQADEGLTVFGGVQLAIPEDFMVTQGGGMLLAADANGSIVINLITPGTMGVGMLDDVDDLEAFFGAMAQEAATGAAGTLSDQGMVVLADGTEAYACTLEVASDGTTVVMRQVYVPLENGSFALAQFAHEAGVDAATADAVAAIADTLVLAPVSEVTYSEFEGAGVKLQVADELMLDETTVDTEPTWYNADGTMMFGLIPDLIDGASQLTEDDYAMMYDQIAASLGGEPWDTTMVQADGVEVRLGGFSFEEDGVVYVGVLGVVPVADDSLTGIMALVPADQVDLYGPMLDTMYESVSVVA